MKKSLILVFAFAALMTWSGTAQAQMQMALGIKGGLNFAKLDVDDFSPDSKTGYHAGAFLLFKMSKIGIQPEILFSRQGTSDFGFDFNFDYINIPVIVKIYLIGGLNLQAGPQFGFLSTAELEDDLSNTLDVKDIYKTTDFSLGLGAGWDLPFGLTIDARYNLGLNDIGDDAALPSTKNQVIQVSLGYKIIKFGK